MTRRILLISVALALAACSHRSRTIDRDDAAKLLLDRNWIDVMPQSKTDRLHVFRFVPSMGGGVFQDRTIFKGEFELFKFKVDDDHIDFKFPEDGTKIRSQYTIEDVDGPEPFDLKLTIYASPRGPNVYYGMRRETKDVLFLEQ
ncbi:MAG TPA: hypothetical protein VL463_15205 [Kofleriaceae bacterium]|nr:hypothetical protein [Kofleriaceae bacterium]